MIAARLAGGNLFLPFLWWGIFLVGDFGSTRSSSEQLGALGFFLRGFCWGGILFFLWGVGGVLDCKCWKKLKND